MAVKSAGVYQKIIEGSMDVNPLTIFPVSFSIQYSGDILSDVRSVTPRRTRKKISTVFGDPVAAYTFVHV